MPMTVPTIPLSLMGVSKQRDLIVTCRKDREGRKGATARAFAAFPTFPEV